MSQAIEDFLRRAGAGSTKLAAKYLCSGLKEEPELIPEAASLLTHEKPAVREGAARALAFLAESHPQLVAPQAAALIAATRSEENPTREAALEALAQVAPLAPDAVAQHVRAIAEVLLGSKRPQLREQAARCLGNCGAGDPRRAHVASEPLIEALSDNPRDKQARQILAAMHQIARGPVDDSDRERMAIVVNPLRGHPDIQVRERAGQLYRILHG